MHVKRYIFAGIAASVLFLLLDAALGILGGIIGDQIFGITAAQPDEAKITFGILFDLINGFILATVYVVIFPALRGEGWIKGIRYGLIVWGLRVVMWAFSTYVMTDISPVLIGISVLTGLVEIMIICCVIAAIYTPTGKTVPRPA